MIVILSKTETQALPFVGEHAYYFDGQPSRGSRLQGVLLLTGWRNNPAYNRMAIRCLEQQLPEDIWRAVAARVEALRPMAG